MKKVSIVLPIYNVDGYLKKCLDSILDQSYTNFECIMVDDGSTDNSGKICDDYAAKDSRFKVIHKKNGGVSSARNMGIEHATGDYLGFIDPDDYVSKDYYKTLIEASEANPDYIIQSNKISFNINETPKPGINKRVRLREIERIAGAVFRVLYDLFIIKKYNIKMFNGLSFYEDSMFNIEYAQLSGKKGVGFIDANYYHLYNRPNSICGLKSDNYGQSNRALRALPILRSYYVRAISEKWKKQLTDKIIPMILEAEEIGTKRLSPYNPSPDLKIMSIGGNCSSIDILGDKRTKGPVDNFCSLKGLSTCKILFNQNLLDSLYSCDIVEPKKVGHDNYYYFDDYLILHHANPYDDKFKTELKRRFDEFNNFIKDIKENNKKYLIYSLNQYDVDEYGIPSKNFKNGINYLTNEGLLEKVIFLGNISVGRRKSYNFKLSNPDEFKIKYIEMYIDEEDPKTQQYVFNKKLVELL